MSVGSCIDHASTIEALLIEPEKELVEEMSMSAK
jgi:hypothetical protein